LRREAENFFPKLKNCQVCRTIGLCANKKLQIPHQKKSIRKVAKEKFVKVVYGSPKGGKLI
jgi:hypothetical protein